MIKMGVAPKLKKLAKPNKAETDHEVIKLYKWELPKYMNKKAVDNE